MPTVGLSARGSQAAIVEELEFGSWRIAREHTPAGRTVNRAERSLSLRVPEYTPQTPLGSSKITLKVFKGSIGVFAGLAL